MNWTIASLGLINIAALIALALYVRGSLSIIEAELAHIRAALRDLARR